MKFDINCKKGSRILGFTPGGYPLDKVLALGEPYSTSPHDLKPILLFKSYSFFNKSVLKPQGVDLGKDKKSMGNFCNLYKILNIFG